MHGPNDNIIKNAALAYARVMKWQVFPAPRGLKKSHKSART
jgi:hypothetical protein